MSNTNFWSHTGSEQTLTSLLVTTLHRSSLPWKRPAWTTSWEKDNDCRARNYSQNSL